MLDAKNKIGKEFYQNLGKLFYAVAIADHSVHVNEIDRLKEVVRNHWLKLEDSIDEFGTDAAFQIETVFDWLLEYEKDGEECYEAFERYYTDHKELFNAEVKNLTMTTARSIAASFYGSNKAELIVLGRLQLLFAV
jgi:hypothetical protein